MEEYRIKGGVSLSGDIEIGGAKNAVVGILPATIITRGVCVIDNVPMIQDVISMLRILESIGAKVNFRNSHCVEIDARGVRCCTVDYDQSRRLRASYYLIGAMLGRFGTANVCMPGGCDFGGARPIDLHIRGFQTLGASFSFAGDLITATSPCGLRGKTFYFDKVSVGATMNVMLAAVTAAGTTRLENCAKEPHIVDLANFLNLCGANIRGAGTDTITIRGVSELHGADYTVMPDQIEAGTYMVAAAATRGKVTINNVTPEHLESITAKLRECGVIVEESGDSVTVDARGSLVGCNVDTQPHPGFPTDMQPQMTAFLATCRGNSFITDSVWASRFKYTDSLNKMGAKIRVVSNTAFVEGVPGLTGAHIKATDLRAGAAMVIAGLAAEGVTTVEDIEHIDRGYEDIVGKLTALGANITRVQTTDPSSSQVAAIA
ncbi:MAG: UDP-N-acetylglucosamine 1-carboxyvinyltransferase [Clostridia bacterium]|nr:UDP-N-acetylglucosamine 1-carboxyvinyltransferase [Clostridia bacterium]